MANSTIPPQLPCRVPEAEGTCGRPTRGRPTLVVERDGQRRMHWDCESGHSFHTLPNLEMYLPCDCDEPLRGDPTVKSAGPFKSRPGR